MLNRRILRTKVFKAVYSYAENPGMTLKEVEALMETSCEAARDLYLFLLSVIGPLTAEARSRIEAARAKFNPTEEELNPNMKFVENGIAPLLEQDPDFSKITEGDDAGKWSCTVRLLGISGEPCKLAGTIFFDSGPDPMPLEGDLSEYLSGFNTGKEVPLVLKGLVKEVPTGAGFSGIVDGWESVEGGNVDAH